MPSTYAAVDLACGNGNAVRSTHSEEDFIILEAEENQDDQGDSQDDDCELSAYDTESDDSNKEVVCKETSVPEKASLTGKSTGISGLSADSDDTFRARLDLEFKRYKEAKTQFLLSLVHDAKSTKCEDDVNKLDKVYALFGDEIIILRDLNDSVGSNIRSGASKEKKVRRDRNLRIKSRSRTNSRENTVDLPLESKRDRTRSEGDNNVPTQGRDLGLPTNSVIDGNAVQEERPLLRDDHDAPVVLFQFEEHPSPELEAERERRVKLRKMYRWERYRFGRFALDEKPHDLDVTASTPLLDTKIEFRIPRKHHVTKQERREKIGDSLFKEECRKNVCYIDSKDAELDQQMLPIITASNYQKVLIPEPPLARTASANQKEVIAPEKEEPETPNLGKTPAGLDAAVQVKNEIEKAIKEDTKKSKKDKKMKKRRNSSSSEDLEELERKSEARLGKHK